MNDIVNTPEPSADLEVAIAHARGLLEKDHELAAEQALEILRVIPQYAPARLVLASAHRRAGDALIALEVLDELVRVNPQWADAHYERGLVLGTVGRGDAAVLALERAVKLKPKHPNAWRYLADHLMAIGATERADAAYTWHVFASTQNPKLQQAAIAMVENDVPKAERLLKSYLKSMPTDVAAIRMLAEVAVRCGKNESAESLLLRCLELAPSFNSARYNYAVLLHRRNSSSNALIEVERLLETEPQNPSYRNLYAVILSRIGNYELSSKMYAELLAEYPGNAKVWLSYGHVLKTQGRQEACIDAYWRSIERDSGFGEAYWSLANLKTFRFTQANMSVMQAQLGKAELGEDTRLHFHFALGKAFEDIRNYALSFEHYQKGNALHNARINYDPDLNTARGERLKATFSHEFLEARAGSGCADADPIFIVGMPRAGSTLLEQILSSHSSVEGTTELPEIISIAKELREKAEDNQAYDDVLASLSNSQLRELGESYIADTRIHRKTNCPFFIDKMPNNFLHAGMIHMILPNAKIVDARRHPLGCCFSNFKQYYARGQSFSYDLINMGRFYNDYVQLMAHYDNVLPGRVHRVIYERTVEDTETVVRELLDYCGLPFEENCLRFFENTRPVRTASSEQVRQPINKHGVEQWHHFEPWLDPLKEILDSNLDRLWQ